MIAPLSQYSFIVHPPHILVPILTLVNLYTVNRRPHAIERQEIGAEMPVLKTTATARDKGIVMISTNPAETSPQSERRLGVAIVSKDEDFSLFIIAVSILLKW